MEKKAEVYELILWPGFKTAFILSIVAVAGGAAVLLRTGMGEIPSAELPDEEYGLVLSTGRTLYHYNAATQTRRAAGLAAKQPRAFV